MQQLSNQDIFELCLSRRKSKNELSHKWKSYLLPFIEAENIYLPDIEPSQCLDFSRYIESLNISESGARMSVDLLKFITELMVVHGIINSFEWPPNAVGKGKPPKPILVLPPDLIQDIRKQNTAFPIKSIAMFELMLSSGMRISEIITVPVYRVNFDDDLFDSETGKKSEYIGGTIYLNSNEMIVKRGKSRLVAFSRFTARFIKMHMKVMGYNGDEKLPLFPYTSVGVNNMLGILTEIPMSRASNYITQKKPQEEVQDSIVDYSTLSSDQNKSIKRFLEIKEQLKEREKNMDNSKVRRSAFRENVDDREVTPHVLRYTFSSIMYFREYRGKRFDSDAVSKWLGHSSDKTTDLYLQELCLVKSDNEWRKIILGDKRSWQYIAMKSRMTVVHGSTVTMTKAEIKSAKPKRPYNKKSITSIVAKNKRRRRRR